MVQTGALALVGSLFPASSRLPRQKELERSQSLPASAALLALRRGAIMGSSRSRSDPQPLMSAAADGLPGLSAGGMERRSSMSRFAPLSARLSSSSAMHSTAGETAR